MTLPHTTGMITLTNGSTLITGTGTDWQTAGIVGGMVFPTAIGNVLPIAAVNSNTQMVAAVPWTGPTVSTQYALVRDTAYLQQLTENAALLTTVIRELRYSSLAALAALAPTMGADKLPFATSANAMAWTPFTAYGRQLVAVTTDAGFASAAKVVRRSGGSNMTSYNDIMIGWHSAVGGLIGQVDAVYLGNIWNDYYATTQGGAADIRSKIGAFPANGGTLSGSIMATGNLSASGAVSSSSMYNISAANADGAVYFQTGAVGSGTYNRWAWVKTGYGVGEPGGNVSADMKLMRWGDASQYLGTSIVATRKTGAVHFPETPFCQTNLGADIVILPGYNTGVSTSGFTFNRGGFIIGGDLNGRSVVHFPIAGWYRCSFTAAANSPDGAATLELVLNGSNVPAHIGTIGATFNVINNTVMLLVNANDYLNVRALGGRIFFAGWNTRCILEFIQPI